MRPISQDLHRVVLFTLLLGVLLAVGTIGYTWIEGWPASQSLYMTVITMTTVGYEEVEPLSEAGRRFTIGLIFSGLVKISVGISILTSTLIESRFDQFLRHRRKEKAIMKLTGHYIVCGAGQVGRVVLEELRRRDVPHVIIDINHEVIEALEPTRRGIYCGAVGYLDGQGGGDLNIAIRTAWTAGGRLYYQAGGGIVADSNWETEWEEAGWKAHAFLDACAGR